MLPARAARPPLTVRVRPGAPLSAVLAVPERRSAAARMGELLMRRWPRAGGCVVEVVDARSTIYSLRTRDDALIFRVHHAVLDHERDVMEALLRRDAEAWKRVQGAFSSWRTGVEAQGLLKPARAEALEPRGRVHDLSRLFDQQNAAHFGGALCAPIGWGRWPPNGPRSRIRLGSCGGKPPRIRIHPVLDHADVPERFVSFIVFHEQLHLAMPPRQGSGSRRLVHPPALRAAERAHPDYAWATGWEREHIDLLLRRARGPAR